MKKALVTVGCTFVGVLAGNLVTDKIREWRIKKTINKVGGGIFEEILKQNL